MGSSSSGRSTAPIPGQVISARLYWQSGYRASFCLTPNTSHPVPSLRSVRQKKTISNFQMSSGTGVYKNTNLATLHFESPLNCVFTPVIILGGSRPVPVGFVERWRWCARRRCLNTDRKRTLQWFICYARACSTSAVPLVFRQLCTCLVGPLAFIADCCCRASLMALTPIRDMSVMSQ